MSEKGERQRGTAPHAPEASADLPLDFAEVVRAEIGELPALDVAPHEFGRVEIRGVAGQPLDGAPRPLGPEVRRHGAALVRGQAVPDQDDAPPPTMPLELAEEADQCHVVVAAGARVEEEITAAAVPAEGQGHGEGEFGPIERVDQNRGFAPWGPRPADRRPLRDAALVLEDEPGPAAPSVFFTAGQRVVTQCWTAASFRSFARLAGRCRVQSSAPKSRHTCPG